MKINFQLEFIGKHFECLNAVHFENSWMIEHNEMVENFINSQEINLNEIAIRELLKQIKLNLSVKTGNIDYNIILK